jgi:hypothetical protein
VLLGSGTVLQVVYSNYLNYLGDEVSIEVDGGIGRGQQDFCQGGWSNIVLHREKGRVAKEGVGLPSQLERPLQLGW